MQQLLSSLADDRERQFRRFVGFSAATHVALAILFWWSPLRPAPGTVLPAVVKVDLVAAADLSPAPVQKPVAEPKPAPPPPPPPPPPQAKKVLPKQPAPLPKPKPKPKPAEAKKPPKVEPKATPAPQATPAPEQDYDDVLAELRKEAGETAPKPVQQAAVAPMVGGPSGPGQVVSPEMMRWIQEVKAHVTRAWILAPGFRLQPLVTEVRVELSASGAVGGTRIVQSSGNPWYDESVERAIQKATPLPAPPRAGEWNFSFDAREF